MVRGAVGVLAAAALVAATAGCGDDEVPAATGVTVSDVAAEAGIAATTTTHGENCVADLDGDGHLDLLLSAHEDPWTLHRGHGDGRFDEDDALDLEPLDRHGCAVADFDGDGRLDVYFSVGACRGRCEEPKELWLQQPDGTFADEAEAWGVADQGGRGRVPVVLDADGDDRPDLFTGQETGVDFPSENRLWLNRGGRFELHPGEPTSELGNICASAGDLDGDELDELAVCTPDQGFFLYRNVGGDFVEDTEGFEVDGYGRRWAELADVDLDGAVDLVTVTRVRVQVHRNVGGSLADITFSVDLTDGKDVAIGDADGDGHLDLYVQQGLDSDEPDRIYFGEGDGGFGGGVDVPGTAGLAGDSVVAVPDYRGSGRAAFLVNNGFQDTPGPRQLFVVTGDREG